MIKCKKKIVHNGSAVRKVKQRMSIEEKIKEDRRLFMILYGNNKSREIDLDSRKGGKYERITDVQRSERLKTYSKPLTK